MTDSEHLATLQRHWKQHRSFPAAAQVGEVLRLDSSEVFGLLSRLGEAGYLQRAGARLEPGRAFFARPLLGTVRAGLPQPASQERAETLTLDDYLIDRPDRTSLHRVRGDSMVDAGILEGDLVVVEHQSSTKAGDIVLAVVDGELTVKTLSVDAQGAPVLLPANAAYPTIVPSGSLEILGVVVSVVRRLRR